MTTGNAKRSVLLIGKSQLVLDDSVGGLRDLGYKAEATNDFADITGRFDVRKLDVIVFGGQVPPDRKAELTQQIGAINPHVTFVHGLAGIPGLIINQVRGAAYVPGERSIRLTLTGPANVKVTAWWQTSFVPPDPKSDSLVLLDDRLAGGDYTVDLPDHVPPKAAFATVQIDAAIYAFSIATEH
jgi:hypothetical protein